jgi:hypothetical protein
MIQIESQNYVFIEIILKYFKTFFWDLKNRLTDMKLLTNSLTLKIKLAEKIKRQHFIDKMMAIENEICTAFEMKAHPSFCANYSRISNQKLK